MGTQKTWGHPPLLPGKNLRTIAKTGITGLAKIPFLKEHLVKQGYIQPSKKSPYGHNHLLYIKKERQGKLQTCTKDYLPSDHLNGMGYPNRLPHTLNPSN